MALDIFGGVMSATGTDLSRAPIAVAARIEYREARISDSFDIANLLCIAGGGVYEFLFDDLIPFVTAREFLAAGIASDHAPISYQNCFLAVSAEGDRVLGLANAFPADCINNNHYPIVSDDRIEHIRSMLELQDSGSMFLNALAVDASCRGLGVGSRLLEWASAKTREAKLKRLSLHVWADNTAARKFYEAHGFAEIAVAEVVRHARLEHQGGSILMSAPV